ncbi:uncharacterized protein SPAPADRAFT_59994 [Spathaspora passalidarum NRRL Y-27907]|uniref:Uncharacterized protein n=1 Tax=Spathaspora passalidarum (strain NRRL Y-27907 / 11-Y1) TaxID=619300 RepID=G3AJA7_SPAPN|nr:uncharacterized protein SPAPADRAFT_59994 [Spathaspora passalidarum NRRL Y-27907]EGW34566.1 hypothetical protein SPAPADRAFT_59994 [Spathaspora passalidarum NRRL Y-27907]
MNEINLREFLSNEMLLYKQFGYPDKGSYCIDNKFNCCLGGCQLAGPSEIYIY